MQECAVENFLRTVPLFSDLSEEKLSWLAGYFDDIQCVARQIVFRHGEEADAFFLVREGTVSVYTDTVGEPVRLLARVGPGNFFGGHGLLEGNVRSASARASESTSLLRIPKGLFLAFLIENPTIELRLRLIESRRVKENIASMFAEGRRDEVRIKVDRRVLAQMNGDREVECRLENLSKGGCCVFGMPLEWDVEQQVRLDLLMPDKSPLLHIDGRVAWREDARSGIAFETTSVDHSDDVNTALRQLLNCD